jgi:hypothetical protein
MNDYLERFRTSPPLFKKSFVLLCTAWICHLLYFYSLFWSQGAVELAIGDIKKMAVVSVSLCFFLFLMKKWSRALVVMGSCLILIYDLFAFVAMPRNAVSSILCVTVVLFTILGMYFLFSKDVRAYFNQINPKPERQEPLS